MPLLIFHSLKITIMTLPPPVPSLLKYPRSVPDVWLDVALSVWLIQPRAKGAAVPGAVIQEEALTKFELQYLHVEPGFFKVTFGWLHRQVQNPSWHVRTLTKRRVLFPFF